jgi:uncharacterized membrane protein YfcA
VQPWALWLGAAGSVALSGAVRGFAGFGGALVMSPLLSLLYGPSAAVAMVVAIELVGFLQLLPGAAPRIRWREIAPMAAAALLALPLGVSLVVSLDPQVMRRAIGGIVTGLGLLLLLGRRLAVRPALPAALGVAGLSGLLQGLAGTPGPPVVLYLFAGPDPAGENRRQLIGYFALLDLAGAGIFALRGVYTPEIGWRIAALLPLTLLGTWLGAALSRRVGERGSRLAVLGLILAVGLAGMLY